MTWKKIFNDEKIGQIVSLMIHQNDETGELITQKLKVRRYFTDSYVLDKKALLRLANNILEFYGEKK